MVLVMYNKVDHVYTMEYNQNNSLNLLMLLVLVVDADFENLGMLELSITLICSVCLKCVHQMLVDIDKLILVYFSLEPLRLECNVVIVEQNAKIH